MVVQLGVSRKRGPTRRMQGGALVKFRGGNLFKKISNMLGTVRGKLQPVVDFVKPKMKTLQPILVDVASAVAKGLAGELGKNKGFDFDTAIKAAAPGILGATAKSISENLKSKPEPKKKAKKAAAKEEEVEDVEILDIEKVPKPRKRKAPAKKKAKKAPKRGGQMIGKPSLLAQLLHE